MSVIWVTNSSFPGNTDFDQPHFITRRSRWLFFWYSPAKFCLYYLRMNSKFSQQQCVICASNSPLPRCPFSKVEALIYNSLTLQCELGQHLLKSDRTLASRRPLVKHFWEMVKMMSFLQKPKTHLHGGLQRVVAGPVTSAWLRNLFKMQIIRPPESEPLGVEPSDLRSNSPWGGPDAY